MKVEVKVEEKEKEFEVVEETEEETEVKERDLQRKKERAIVLKLLDDENTRAELLTLVKKRKSKESREGETNSAQEPQGKLAPPITQTE